MIRTTGHETMLYFPGKWFPKSDPENKNGIFEASMLALFKPWKSVIDLKRPGDSFRLAFDEFRGDRTSCQPLQRNTQQPTDSTQISKQATENDTT